MQVRPNKQGMDPTCQGSIVNSAANFPVQQSARPRSPTMSVGVLVKQELHSERHAKSSGLWCSTQRLAPLRSRWQIVRRPGAACTEYLPSLSEELYDGSDVI